MFVSDFPGIGREIAKNLAKYGANVIAVGRTVDLLGRQLHIAYLDN